MPNQTYNPIQSVGGTVVPCPSKYTYNLQDVSAADAGRTEDGLMHKMRIAQKVKLEMEWQNASDSDANTILTAFQPEYIYINYYDYKSMGFATKRFYVGDRKVESYNRAQGIGTIAFNVIER